jgi:tRNA-uridine 2-sulfurtransferase
MKKVMAAMSGGVDSSVAALLLKQAGYDVTGVTMCLGVKADGEPSRARCCGPDAINDAKRVAEQLSIPHFVLDFSARLQDKVIDRFVDEYRSGRTPNPCVDCNRFLKFDALLSQALALGFEGLATGHYAGIEQKDGTYLLTRPKDRNKDQTYFLAGIPRAALGSILFPLQSLTKDEVRAIAKKARLPVAEKPESQDICFVPDGDCGGFVARRAPEQTPGPIVDTGGRVIGAHKGIAYYTIGQRGGLGIAAKRPFYVTRIDAGNNTIIVGAKDDLRARGLICSDFNVLVDEIPERLTVKIRYTKKEAYARIMSDNTNTMNVIFDDPQEAITPGQAVVLYSDDVVLGGGMIECVLDDHCTVIHLFPQTKGI